MAFGQPCNVTGAGMYGPCPGVNERCSPVSGDIGQCQPANLPDPGSPNYPTTGPGAGPGFTCTNGYVPEWNPTTLQWVCPTGTEAPPPTSGGDCPPGYHHGGGHPGNPCRPDAVVPVGTPGTPGTPSTSSQSARFYTPSWEDYFWSGGLEAGVPQPTGSLLDLLAGNIFQQAAGQFGISPLQDWQMATQARDQARIPLREGRFPDTPPRPGLNPGVQNVGVLGLPGGGVATGHIDPSWRFDTLTTPGTPGTPGTSPGLSTPVVPGTPGVPGANPCGSTQGCPPGFHRGGCHPGNPCKPDGGGVALETAPAPTPLPTPNPAPGPPGPNPGPIATAAPGLPSPVSGTLGCPPGCHRGGGHPGNPCKQDGTGGPCLGARDSTATFLGGGVAGGGGAPSLTNTSSLLNPGSFMSGASALSGRPLFTSSFLGGR